MSLKTVLRIIEISRPVFWPSTFFIFLLGIIFSRHEITSIGIFYAFLWSFPYSLWLSTVNDLADMKTDNINTFKGGISGVKVKDSEIIFLKRLQCVSFLTIIVPILFTFSAGGGPAYGWNYLFLFASLAALIIPYTYSSYPIRLKEKPPFDSLSNGAFVVSVFIAGYVFNGENIFENIFIQACIAIFLGVSAMHIFGALRDYTPDKKSKVKTSAVFFGQKMSAFFASVFFFVAYGAIFQFPFEFRLFCLSGTMAGLFLILKPSERRSFQLGFFLLFLFFSVCIYSIFFNTWKLVLQN